MLLYKDNFVFLSDIYSKYELNVLEFLRRENKVLIYGQLSIKNIFDDGLVENAHTIFFVYINDDTIELQEFFLFRRVIPPYVFESLSKCTRRGKPAGCSQGGVDFGN